MESLSASTVFDTNGDLSPIMRTITVTNIDGIKNIKIEIKILLSGFNLAKSAYTPRAINAENMYKVAIIDSTSLKLVGFH